MWFKNTQTGHIWETIDEQFIKELQAKDHFVEVDSPIKEKEEEDKSAKPSSKRNNPNQTKTMECEVCGRECKGQRSYTQHRRMAHGIEKDGDK